MYYFFNNYPNIGKKREEVLERRSIALFYKIGTIFAI